MQMALAAVSAGASIYSGVMQQSVARAVQEWQFEFTNLDGDVRTIEGEALIQNLPISGDVQSFVQCTVNIIGTGAFVMDASPSSPTADENVDSDFWSATAGQQLAAGSPTPAADARAPGWRRRADFAPGSGL